MKITAIRIRAFGSLKEVSLTNLPDRLLLVMPNGGGKTTLLEFIFALLYGLGNRGGRQSRRSRFLPWEGGPAGGQIDVYSQRLGGTYRVEGRFGGQSREDRLSLWDLNSGLQIELAKGELPGHYLTGLEAEVFRSLVLAGEGELKPSAVRDRQNKRSLFLARLFSGDSAESGPLPGMGHLQEGAATLEALKKLEKRRQQLRSTRGDKGMIPALEKELIEVEKVRYEGEERRQEYRKLRNEKAAAEEKLRRLKTPELNRTAPLIREQVPDVVRANEVGLPAGRRRRPWLAALFLVLSVLSLILGGLNFYAIGRGQPLFGRELALVLILFGLLVGVPVLGRLICLNRNLKTMVVLDASDLDFSEGKRGQDRSEEVDTLKETIARISGQLDLLKRADPSLIKPDERGQSERLQQELASLYREYRALSLARTAMVDLARLEQTEHFQPFRQPFYNWASQLAMPEVKEAHLQKDLGLQVGLTRPGAPAFISAEDLSYHEGEVLGLALRLTLAGEAVRQSDQACPLLFDEPFSGWDDRRTEAAWRAVSGLSVGGNGQEAGCFTQVICLLSSRREAEWVARTFSGWSLLFRE